MLEKLLKYEIKATARLFLPLYLVILLFAIASRYLNPFKVLESPNNISLQAILSALGMFLYFALIVAIIAMTLIIMIQRFYKNLLGDEGFLMFTLPVKPWQHIISKLLISILWVILSFLVIICSILILVPDLTVSFNELKIAINTIRTYVGNTGLILIPVLPLIGVASFIIVVYNALAIGHLFTKHKLLASFGAYIGLYIVGQVVSGIFVLSLGNTVFKPFISGVIPTPNQISTLMVAIILFYVLLAIPNFIITNIILNKRLNLE